MKSFPSFSVTTARFRLSFEAVVTSVRLAFTVNPVFPPVVFLYEKSSLFLFVHEYMFLSVSTLWCFVPVISLNLSFFIA